MFEKEAEEYAENREVCDLLVAISEDLQNYDFGTVARYNIDPLVEECFKDGAEFGYNKANERHSPDEHIDKDRVVLGIIKLCNKTRYSLVQWNGEWWYQYGSFNAEVRLIAWYNIPELPKEIKENEKE